jgi:hypothetical protein
MGVNLTGKGDLKLSLHSILGKTEFMSVAITRDMAEGGP